MVRSFLSFLSFSFVAHASGPRSDPRLLVIDSFVRSQPIALSVSGPNRVFVSFPRKDAYIGRLAEIREGGRIPLPDSLWKDRPAGHENGFVNVQDIYVDTDDQLWVLDSKPGAGNSVFGKAGN